ncbi:hypothetical protein I8752_13270 [Nostocaceae cyanobacterium CENA369]|uniref:Uncharacterized protein n=1 Tax=Dendronalium phyllosphericum CENA369 TaxID=1725256 RepID=A0A8J7I0W5_9NOST|nr:hypothetical protein [Dendronalium phyllosphericum]MBH8573974.1 hypothetical protein [Dendronalium phyllosphericum CENA369]
MSATNSPPQLQRELGVFGATLMGLGSIVGTGVFVSAIGAVTAMLDVLLNLILGLSRVLLAYVLRSNYNYSK